MSHPTRRHQAVRHAAAGALAAAVVAASLPTAWAAEVPLAPTATPTGTPAPAPSTPPPDVAAAQSTSGSTPKPPPVMSNDDLVQSWYVSVLGRGPADAADDYGRRAWVEQLIPPAWVAQQGGARDDSDQRDASRRTVVRKLASTEEFVRDHVRATYREVLRRDPDSGSDHWVREVLAGRLTVDDVDRAVLSSREVLDRWGSSTAGRDRYVQDLYAAVLGRYSSDTTRRERSYWVRQLEGGSASEVVAAMWTTPEAVRHRVDRVYRLVLRRPVDSSGLRYWAGVDEREGLVGVVAGVAAADAYLAVDWKAPYALVTSPGPFPHPYDPKAAGPGSDSPEESEEYKEFLRFKEYLKFRESQGNGVVQD